MTDWYQKWQSNGWRNAAGFEVVNRDLIEEALESHEFLLHLGKVQYEWIPRAENQFADDVANEVLDGSDRYYESSSDDYH